MFSRIALRNVAARLPALARVQSSSSECPANQTQRKGRPIYPQPVRHGFIPEPWFQFFYNKTGYTGPYALFTGISTFLVSKEWYILEHEFYCGVSVFVLCIIVAKKLGPPVSKFIDDRMDKQEAEMEQTRMDEIEGNRSLIEHEKRQQWRTEVQQMVIDAKKTNILMQLEGTYRERVALVYSEVKKRLDYQLQIANIERRVSQKHMAGWIINSVLQSITPDQEKATLQQCIVELQELSSRG